MIYKAGPIDPPEITPREQARVHYRIGQERLRYYREIRPDTALGRISRVRLFIKTAEKYGLPTDGLDDPDKMGRDHLHDIATEE
ncbi:MAG: hypothetical protein U5N86_13395 [Planctomycetota bacterium]|nr:hypothetical protein [Planctomycetota bacterium]